MTVQELIDELEKIEDKLSKVFFDSEANGGRLLIEVNEVSKDKFLGKGEDGDFKIVTLAYGEYP